MTDRTQTVYYEKKPEEEIIRNRRLLYHVMTENGFTNLPSEWWHYDYGDRFWAYYNQKSILYDEVYTREEIHAK